MKHILGNLNGFDTKNDMVHFDKLTPVDKITTL